jgi:5-formyltetrahydrofolate cyclo-ligase
VHSPEAAPARLEISKVTAAPMTKSELRKLYLERRRSISAAEHAELSGKIVEELFGCVDFGPAEAVHCFISMEHKGEIETGKLFERLWADLPHIKTFAPRIDDTSGELIALPYGRETRLERSRWNIPEPIDGDPADPVAIDVVVVPLLCFDERGHRVGYGRGYYDRFLKKCRPDCIKAGLSFFPPVERIDDIHEGDLALDVCVTPSQTFRLPTI